MVMMLVSLLDLSLQSTFSGRGSCQEGSIIHMLTNRVTFNQSSASYGVVPQKVKFFSGKSTHRDREAWYEDLTIQLVVRCLFSLETSEVDSLWVHGQKILSFPELATLAWPRVDIVVVTILVKVFELWGPRLQKSELVWFTIGDLSPMSYAILCCFSWKTDDGKRIDFWDFESELMLLSDLLSRGL